MSSENPAICVLLSTCPPEAAERLAMFLVENRHAACVNIVPQVKSIYRWEGKLQRDDESLLVIKCAAARAAELTDALLKEHPYSVPEVVCLSVSGGSVAYLSWVLKSAED
jgi:periplasmic divalent cation tolerance protein